MHNTWPCVYKYLYVSRALIIHVYEYQETDLGNPEGMLGVPIGAHVLGLAKDVEAGESKSEISFQFLSTIPRVSLCGHCSVQWYNYQPFYNPLSLIVFDNNTTGASLMTQW